MDQESSNNQAGNLRLPPPHDELWYEDGNILLATDAHLYRVHKSVLAKQSTVFKDMFELSGMPPEVGEETGKSAMLLSEEWDGLQVVKMFGDSDEDVRYFVKALYNRECVFLYELLEELKLTQVYRSLHQFLPDVRVCHRNPACSRVTREHEHQIRRSHHPKRRNS